MDIERKIRKCRKLMAQVESEIDRMGVCTKEHREHIDELERRIRWLKFRRNVERGDE